MKRNLLRALLLAIVAFGAYGTTVSQSLFDGGPRPTCDPFSQVCSNQ